MVVIVVVTVVCVVSDDVNLNLEEAIAETCALELFEKPHMVRWLHTGVCGVRPFRLFFKRDPV